MNEQDCTLQVALLGQQQQQLKQPTTKKLKCLMFIIAVFICILFSILRNYWISSLQNQTWYPPPPALKYQSTKHGATEHRATGHGATEYGATEHGATEYGATQHGATEHGATEHGGAEHGATEHGATEHGATEHGDAERHEPKIPNYCGVKTVPRERHAALENVEGMKTVLIAAYREHRSPIKEVRVLTIVKRSESLDYLCIFCCQGKLLKSAGTCDIHTDHFGFAYGTGDIMCPLPYGCERPSHVAVTKKNTVSLDKPQSLSEVFLEVKDQEERKDSFPYNFTVCISTMFDFDNVLQLVQTLEMYRLLGANKVAIYNESYNAETQRVLDYYSSTGFVDAISWKLTKFLQVSRNWKPERGPGDLHYHGQIPALNDCLYRYMYQSRYLAMNDIDEIILPETVDSWMELLPVLEKEHHGTGCYKFMNNVYPTTISVDPKLGTRNWPAHGVDILKHVYSEPVPHDYNFKIIINPRRVSAVSVHGVLKSERDCVWADTRKAVLHHTRAPNQPDLPKNRLIHNDRLLHYGANLVRTVDKAFTEIYRKRD